MGDGFDDPMLGASNGTTQGRKGRRGRERRRGEVRRGGGPPLATPDVGVTGGEVAAEPAGHGGEIPLAPRGGPQGVWEPKATTSGGEESGTVCGDGGGKLARGNPGAGRDPRQGEGEEEEAPPKTHNYLGKRKTGGEREN